MALRYTSDIFMFVNQIAKEQKLNLTALLLNLGSNAWFGLDSEICKDLGMQDVGYLPGRKSSEAQLLQNKNGEIHALNSSNGLSLIW